MRRSAVMSILLLALFAGTLRAAAPASVKDGTLSAQGAIALAEKFVAEQHFTDLQSKAVGARAESDVWFVGFRATTGDSIRGIMVAQNGKKLKRVSQNLQTLHQTRSRPTEVSVAVRNVDSRRSHCRKIHPVWK